MPNKIDISKEDAVGGSALSVGLGELLPIELDKLIQWHGMCAQVADQTDDFGGARFHSRRRNELEKRKSPT